MTLFSRYKSAFFRDLTMLGGSLFYLLLLLATLLLGTLGLFWNLLLGFFITLAAIVTIRTFYFKPRPQKKEYHTFIEKIDASSFPSWHAARAIFLALTLGNFTGNSGIMALLLFLAFLVGYSRVYLRKHDGIDVAGGLLLGLATFFLTVNLS